MTGGTGRKPALDELVADLDAERAAVIRLVTTAGARQWTTPTASPGWTVRDQVVHLSVSDELARMALTDPARFAGYREQANSDRLGFERVYLDAAADMSLQAAVDEWRRVGAALAQAFGEHPASQRVVWFGPSMSPLSLASARIMEAWAHGRDIADAVGLRQVQTDRLRHVAALGVRARNYGYVRRGLAPPDKPVRVELSLPTGAAWTVGPPDADDRVQGLAEDFCLVLARRRPVEQTGLSVTGHQAREWMTIGQMFAGPAEPPAA